MRIGLYEIDITPPLEAMIPGYFTLRPGEGMRDPLYARAMACENEQGDIFILVNMDAIQVNPFMSRRVRGRIEELTGIPGERVMVSATHTHTGGPVSISQSNSPAFSEEYIHWAGDRAADAAVMAWNMRRSARLGFGKAEERSISFVRRYFMKDGTLKTNPGYCAELIDRPESDIDPEVGVVKIEDESGKLIGVITNFACHLDTVGGNRYSADYPGELARVLKAVYGQEVISIFLTGACGNINHCDFMHRTADYYRKANPPHHIRMGRILAGDVIRALADIETQESEIIRVENASFPALIRTPTEEAAAQARALLEKTPYVPVIVRESGASGSTEGLQQRSSARSLLEVYADPNKQVDVPVQAVRLGEAAIVGVPCELFVEFGLDIKKRGRFEHTMISTLTNAQFGYISTREAMFSGGYETTISGSTKMSAETGYDMADTAVELLARMR